jgi:hypothetical protein
MTTPIASSGEEVTALRQELGDIHAARTAAYSGGAGPTYSISGPNGSESVDIVGYLKYLSDREDWILQRLQDLEPFMAIQQRNIRGTFQHREHGW